jgi:hypothetical protein
MKSSSMRQRPAARPSNVDQDLLTTQRLWLIKKGGGGVNYTSFLAAAGPCGFDSPQLHRARNGRLKGFGGRGSNLSGARLTTSQPRWVSQSASLALRRGSCSRRTTSESGASRT